MGRANAVVPFKARARAVAAPEREPQSAELPWSLPKVAVAGALWGQGLVAPFDESRADALVDALDICAADRVLLVGAGPGGAQRLLAGASGADVVAYEADPLLALLGGARSFNARSPDFGRHSFDLAVVLDFPSQAQPQDILAAVALALRPDGMMAVESSLADPDGMPRALRHLRCSIEAAEDRSMSQIDQVVAGWARLASLLGRRGGASLLPAEGRHALLQEAERWMPRIRRLRSGTLRHVRLLSRRCGVRAVA